jgi:hypothetical protein
MSDKGPVLDYQSPQDSPKETFPLAARVTAGILAGFTTLIAAICLGVGICNAIDGMGIANCFPGIALTVVACLLWLPTGLVWPHRNKEAIKDSNGPTTQRVMDDIWKEL